MRQATIAEMRKKDVDKLAEITKDRREAERFFNSFYRLAGLTLRLVYLESNERSYERNKRYIEAENEREYKWLVRLNAQAKGYGLKVISSNGYLSLYPLREDGTLGSAFTYGHYYN